MNRYGIFRIVGSGTEQDPYRPDLTGLTVIGQTNSVMLIPSKPDGSPKYRYAFGEVSADDFLAVTVLANNYLFPNYQLGSPMSGMAASARTAMVQAVRSYNMDGTGYRLDASHSAGELYRDVIVRIARQIDPNFTITACRVSEPMQRV